MQFTTQNFLNLFLSGVAASCLGCTSEVQQPVKADRPQYTAFQQAARSGTIVAVASGGAYLKSNQGIYYFENGRAEMIEGLSPNEIQDIVALADGSALALPNHKNVPRLFWLRGNRAVEVSEGEVIGLFGTPENSQHQVAGFYFIEGARLRRSLDEANEEISLLEEDLYQDD